MMDRCVRLARWLGSQVGQMVPEDLAVCEFECRETTCTAANWKTCGRRRERRLARPRASWSREESESLARAS
jgi:hypothetical protein